MTRFERATSTLARLRSTPELHPLNIQIYNNKITAGWLQTFLKPYIYIYLTVSSSFIEILELNEQNINFLFIFIKGINIKYYSSSFNHNDKKIHQLGT